MRLRLPRPATTALALATALVALAAAPAAPADATPATAAPLPAVQPRAETPPMYDDEAGGNADADDPAIWRNPADPARSLVIATAKEGGLRVYDLDARLVQSLPAPPPARPGDAPGRFNNVDLVHGLRLSTGRADLAVTTDRGHDRLRVHRVSPGRTAAPLRDVTDPAAPRVFSSGQAEVNEQRTAYGLATWTDPRSGRAYAVVSRRERTELALLELLPTRFGTVTYRQVRTLRLPASFRLPGGATWTPCAEPGALPQVEGMVVDPDTGTLYAAQEDVGIWRLPADLTGAPRLTDRVREFGVPGVYDEETDECVPGADPGHGGTRLSADVEGLTLVTGRDGVRHLLVSSQGDDTFALYRRDAYAAGFRVTAGRDVDGSEECDGAAALNAPLGPKYPHGLLVVHDGHEDAPAGREATNFKFVDLGEVLRRTSL
ncbi:phytase [Streptomyces sp. NPDC005805]|uniref:phytase n=1 Tax=Streptomyces sp. NPDC005805 TaxID=3157068 RepID=UPI0033F695B4